MGFSSQLHPNYLVPARPTGSHQLRVAMDHRAATHGLAGHHSVLRPPTYYVVGACTHRAREAFDVARAEMERICSVRCEWPGRVLAPVLRDSRGGALVNMLSVLSFISTPPKTR